jgi:hypothetical protein
LRLCVIIDNNIKSGGAAMTENEISKHIVDCAIEVHRTLGGPGLLESIYSARSQIGYGDQLRGEVRQEWHSSRRQRTVKNLTQRRKDAKAQRLYLLNTLG